MNDARSALVLFSGGQDSTTCLAWALARFAHVETIAFDYRQRHRIELDQRPVVLAEIRRRFPQWAARLGDDHFIDLGVLGQISDTSLTRDTAIAMEKDGLPSTFVPGRNLLFFTFAAAVAWRRGIRNLRGRHVRDGFFRLSRPPRRHDQGAASRPQCRHGPPLRAAHAADVARQGGNLGLAQELGGGALVEILLEHTHTCYQPDRGPRHDWGYGCGDCPACALRKRGYEASRSAIAG